MKLDIIFLSLPCYRYSEGRLDVWDWGIGNKAFIFTIASIHTLIIQPLCFFDYKTWFSLPSLHLSFNFPQNKGLFSMTLTCTLLSRFRKGLHWFSLLFRRKGKNDNHTLFRTFYMLQERMSITFELRIRFGEYFGWKSTSTRKEMIRSIPWSLWWVSGDPRTLINIPLTVFLLYFIVLTSFWCIGYFLYPSRKSQQAIYVRVFPVNGNSCHEKKVLSLYSCEEKKEMKRAHSIHLWRWNFFLPSHNLVMTTGDTHSSSHSSGVNHCNNQMTC
jgi:hypothetical protein